MCRMRHKKAIIANHSVEKIILHRRNFAVIHKWRIWFYKCDIFAVT